MAKNVHTVTTVREISVSINESSLVGLTLCIRPGRYEPWAGCEENLAPVIVNNWRNEPFDVVCPGCDFVYHIVPTLVMLEFDRKEVG